MSAFILASLFAMATPLPAVAQEMHVFNVTKSEPASAIRDFGSQADIHILASADDLKGKKFNAVVGEATTETGLTYLLAGSGLQHRYVGERAVAFVSQESGEAGAAKSGDKKTDSASGVRLAQAGTSASSTPDSERPSAPEKDTDRPLNAPETRATALQEIIVTANKREERLSRVPISIAALTAESMQASGIKSFREVAALTPGVQFDSVSSWGPNLSNIAIRGVNSTIGTSTTGIYLDDTPIQSRVQSFSYIGQPLPFTFDLNRVEVARGPQGTLFGAGAEGGSVRFIASAPSLTQTSALIHTEFAGTQRGTSSYEIGAAAGAPLVDDKIGIRVSGWYRREGGYVDRVDPFTGATVEPDSNRSQSKSARLALVFAVNDAVKITPAVNYQSQHTHDSGTFYESLSDVGQGIFKNGRLLQQPSDDSFYLPSLKIEASLGFAELTSVSSYFHRRASTLYDNTNILGALLGGYGSPLGPAVPTDYADAAPGYIDLRQSFYSQEIRLASADPNARLTWVAGVFYSRTRQQDTESIVSTIFTAQNPILYTDQHIRDTQYAGFGQADFRITDRFKLSAGVRVAHTKYEATQYVGGDLNFGVPPVATGSAGETPVTPKIGLSFQANEHNLFYLTVAKGYRIGGVNTPLASYCGAIVAPKTYDSDSVWSYEIGSKNSLAGGRFEIDASAFHIDWKKIQQPVLIPACGFEYFTNAGAAKSDGFDIAMRALVAERLKLGVAVSYTDAHYTKTVSSDGIVTVERGDAIGNLPQVPSPWNITASTEYEFHLSDQIRATLRLEDIFRSKNSGPFTSYNPAAISYAPNIPPNPSTNVLNVRGTLAWDRWDVDLFVNNALNSLPQLMRNQDSNASDLYYRTTFRPRTIGVSASWRF